MGFQLTFFCFAEASASSGIRTARNVVKDFGLEASRRAGGLVNLARCNARDPEASAHRLLVGKLKLSLPIPLRPLPIEFEDPVHGLQEVMCLHLRDWARFLIDSNNWHVLCGLPSPDEDRDQAIWSEFWRRFREVEPTHEVFHESSNIDWGRTAALVAHGDEGRGRRRQAFFVASCHSVLGQGTVASERVQTEEPFLKMLLNIRGHTYVTRFLCGVLPRDLYMDNDAVFHSLLNVIVSEASFLWKTGLQSRQGHTYRMVLLKNVGDWPYLHKNGRFSRSFNNFQKRAHLVNAPTGICHLCRAGQAEWPVEQFTSERPSWIDTMFTQSPFLHPPAFAQLPHPPGKLESCWAFDMFHCWNLGTGKSYVASMLALLSEREPFTNIDKRFEGLSSRYVMYCHENRRSPILRKISKETILWTTSNDYPNGSWYKGGLTTLFVDWVLDRAANEDFTDNPLLMCGVQAGLAMREALRIMYQSGVWLDANTASRVSMLGLKFLKQHARAASMGGVPFSRCSPNSTPCIT